MSRSLEDDSSTDCSVAALTFSCVIARALTASSPSSDNQ